MKHANNLYSILISYFVKNHVATYRESSIPCPNMVAGLAEYVVLSQQVKGLVKLREVLIALLPAPGFLREFCNSFQVTLGCGFYSEMRH